MKAPTPSETTLLLFEDIQYSVNELSERSIDPSEADELDRIGRLLDALLQRND